jgi:hypothetical protein
MKPLIGSEMAIINQRATKLLYKSDAPIDEPNQWTSDQVPFYKSTG